MNPIRLLDLGSIPPLQTQAVYHALAGMMTKDSPDTIILCRPNEPYLCLGYHQVFDSVFDTDECARRGLPVYRRKLGGGATYLNADQIFYQLVFHHTRMPAMLKDIYAKALSAPVNVLNRLGLSAELRETNEIEVDEKRIAGTGGGRIDEACVVVGNLLFDFDFEAMSAVWKTPSSAFRFLAEQALSRQIVTLKRLNAQTTYEATSALLWDEFAKVFDRPIEAGICSPEEEAEVESVSKELASSEFLALHKDRAKESTLRSLKISARAFIYADEMQLDGFDLKGSFCVSQDLIQDAILESEPANDWSFMCTQLRGVSFKEWKEQILVR